MIRKRRKRRISTCFFIQNQNNKNTHTHTLTDLIRSHKSHRLLRFSLSLSRHQLCLDYHVRLEERIRLIFSPRLEERGEKEMDDEETYLNEIDIFDNIFHLFDYGNFFCLIEFNQSNFEHRLSIGSSSFVLLVFFFLE